MLNKNKKTFSRFCSAHCRSAYTCDIRKKTNIEKYGVDNPFKSIEIQQKRNLTCLAKYGVEKVSDSPEQMKIIKEKQKATCMNRYGVEFAQQHSSIKEKMRTSWGKYSGGHPLSDPVVRAKREETLLSKFGVKHPILAPEIAARCRSGYSNTIAKNRKHLLDTIPELTDKVWLERAVNDIGCVGISSLLGIRVSVVRDSIKTQGIVLPNKRRSIFEKQVCAFISQHYLGEILTNTKLSGTEIDIVLPELKLAIECNGTYWHSELNGRDRHFHQSKTALCHANGYQLIHIWDHDWNGKPDLIKSRIKSKLSVNSVVGARKCSIKAVDSKEANLFLNENHIQGTCQASIRLGLYFGTTLVSLMTFGKSRFNKAVEYELLRYTNASNLTVMGGASKLFAHFRKTYMPSSVISYSDVSFNSGALYQILGFEWTHRSPPAYYYTKNYIDLESRVKFQKHKLKSMLDEFDANYSEWDNMKLNGYDRIWDCGNDVWLWKFPN
jgi:hypothetical protein